MPRPVLSDEDHLGTARILGLPAPASDNEPVRRIDLNSAVEGTAWKDSVRVRTTANVNIASPGASLDGVVLAGNDRALLTGQTAPAENGIYVWNGSTVPMTRALDANTAAELEQAIASVEEGTSRDSSYRQTNVNFNLGTDPINWTIFGQGAGPASETSPGIAEIATQTETDAGTDDARIVTPAKLANWSGRQRRNNTNVGDGSATQYDVTHNFGTRALEVQVWETGGAFRRVDAGLEISLPSVNVVRINFASPPAQNAYQVIIRD